MFETIDIPNCLEKWKLKGKRERTIKNATVKKKLHSLNSRKIGTKFKYMPRETVPFSSALHHRAKNIKLWRANFSQRHDSFYGFYYKKTIQSAAKLCIYKRILMSGDIN